MATIYQCDRCKEPCGTNGNGCWTWKLPEPSSVSNKAFIQKGVDLCTKCTNDLHRWLKKWDG